LHFALFWQISISFGQFALDFNGTVNGIHHTAKLSQKIVTRCVHHTASILLNEICHGGAVNSQYLNRGLLIVSHKTAVTLHIRTEDCGQSTFQTPLCHGVMPLSLMVIKKLDTKL
jgi:hypothetical protein